MSRDIKRIEFAENLKDAKILMLGAKHIDEKQEKVLRIYKVEDLKMQVKVNEVGKNIETNRKIFETEKHICELVFYHDESIDAIIHRLEELKKM